MIGISSAAQSAVGVARGLARTSSRFDNGWRVPEPVSLLIEQLALLNEADIGECYVGTLLRIGGQHALRRADQEGVAARGDPAAIEAVEHVMGQVLLVEDRAAVRDRAQQRSHDRARVGRVGYLSFFTRIGQSIHSGRDRPRRMARRPPPCRDGSRKTASWRSRCCEGRTTWRCEWTKVSPRGRRPLQRL